MHLESKGTHETDPFVKGLEDMSLGWERIAQALSDWAEAMIPTMMKFREALERVYQAWYQIYLEQGAPYGETEEGMARWLKELEELLSDYRPRD